MQHLASEIARLRHEQAEREQRKHKQRAQHAETRRLAGGR